MKRPHRLSLKQAWQERQSFVKKNSNRQELDRFFDECLTFLRAERSRGAPPGALSEGIADFAFEKFGALASNVWRHWGIDSPEELEKSFRQFLRACGSRRVRRTANFAHSEALKALFRGDFWP